VSIRENATASPITRPGLDLTVTFIKAVGGAEQAKKCLEALPPDVPVSLLTEWVTFLAD
jgi:hypothetical protein